jgi:hypothetical protein
MGGLPSLGYDVQTPQIPVDWAEQRKLLGFQQR